MLGTIVIIVLLLLIMRHIDKLHEHLHTIEKQFGEVDEVGNLIEKGEGNTNEQ